MNFFDDEYFMRRALAEAEDAFAEGEVPVGAVAVKDGKIIASASNQVEKLKDATAHAEILLITKVSSVLGDWRLSGVDVFVTKEPCPMCAGALLNSRVRRVFFGVSDPRFGALGGCMNIFALPNLPSYPHVKFGILENECAEIIKKFFKEKRIVKNEKHVIF